MIDWRRVRPAIRCTAKIRYNSPPQTGRGVAHGADELQVRFEASQNAVTPGQAVVLYDGDLVLGGDGSTRPNAE